MEPYERIIQLKRALPRNYSIFPFSEREDFIRWECEVRKNLKAFDTMLAFKFESASDRALQGKFPLVNDDKNWIEMETAIRRTIAEYEESILSISPSDNHQPAHSASLIHSAFISYRRSTSRFLAQLVYRELQARGIDVFLDVHKIDGGRFSTVILQEIRARENFLVIVTPGSFDRCVNEDDWIRMECEEALRLSKNIVPVVDDQVNISDTKKILPASISDIFDFNAVPLSNDYLNPSMDRIASYMRHV